MHGWPLVQELLRLRVLLGPAALSLSSAELDDRLGLGLPKKSITSVDNCIINVIVVCIVTRRAATYVWNCDDLPATYNVATGFLLICCCRTRDERRETRGERLEERDERERGCALNGGVTNHA